MNINNEKIEETKQEINDFIIKSIINELRDAFPQIKVQIKEMMDDLHSYFNIQWYYDIEYNKVYLNYELDKISRYTHNPKELCLRINSRLVNNFHRETGIHIGLVGPISLVKNENMSVNYDMSKQYLRYGVFSYWRIADGSYQFLEDNDRAALDNYKYLMKNSSVTNLMNDFNYKVLEINKKYENFDTKENIESAFEEYSTLYKEVFGRELTAIKQEDINRIFLDIQYE